MRKRNDGLHTDDTDLVDFHGFSIGYFRIEKSKMELVSHYPFLFREAE